MTRPLPLSPWEVRAALDGRLAMIVRPVSVALGPEASWAYDPEGYWFTMGLIGDIPDGWLPPRRMRCPLGSPGDGLWVRETHYVVAAGYPDGRGRHIAYRADDESAPFRWTPSLHMPRWASRLTLTNRRVRCVRVREMTDEEAWATGAIHQRREATTCYDGKARGLFRDYGWARFEKRYPFDSAWAWFVDVEVSVNAARRTTP